MTQSENPWSRDNGACIIAAVRLVQTQARNAVGLSIGTLVQWPAVTLGEGFPSRQDAVMTATAGRIESGNDI